MPRWHSNQLLCFSQEERKLPKAFNHLQSHNIGKLRWTTGDAAKQCGIQELLLCNFLII
uniref:Uncharacterized protein n=1 Tax=Rhizophora mucronata TaxID=61149 RepID=A0A2P2NPN8_RHIMU